MSNFNSSSELSLSQIKNQRKKFSKSSSFSKKDLYHSFYILKNQ